MLSGLNLFAHLGSLSHHSRVALPMVRILCAIYCVFQILGFVPAQGNGGIEGRDSIERSKAMTALKIMTA